MKKSEEIEAFKKRKYYEFVEYALNLCEPDDRERRLESREAESLGIVPFEFGFEAGFEAAKLVDKNGD